MKKEPKSEKPSFFKELGEYIRPYRGQFALSIIVSLLAVFCGLAVYGVVGVLCGEIFEGDRSFVQLLLIIGVAGLCKILNAVFLNLSTYISHKAAFKTLRDIRLALSTKLMRLPLGYFERKGSGRLKTVLVDRVEEVEKTLAHFLPEMTANLCPAGTLCPAVDYHRIGRKQWNDERLRQKICWPDCCWKKYESGSSGICGWY